MKAQIRIDRENEQIIINSGFAKNADKFNSMEYRTLQECRKDYPNYQVITRTIKKNPKKECYKDLTYDYMRNYIASHDSELASAYFEELILRTRCHSTGYRYPTVKKWFLETYPEVKNILGLAVGSFQDSLLQNTTLALPESNVA